MAKENSLSKLPEFNFPVHAIEELFTEENFEKFWENLHRNEKHKKLA